MTNLTKAFLIPIGAAAAALLGSSSVPPIAEARSHYRYMSCEELWYARNQIYAANGYCFKTERGIAAFGRGCFPPYGRLSGADQAEVSEIQRWEARKGCSR